MIRPASLEDFDLIIAIAKAAYADAEGVDVAGCRAWAAQVVLRPDVLIVVGERCFAVGSVSATFYRPDVRKGYMLFLAGLPGAVFEECAALRYLISWAKERGAQSFHFGEQTGVNLAPIARRVGATVDRPSYVVEMPVWESTHSTTS